MSRCRWILAIVVSLASAMALGAVSAQEPAPETIMPGDMRMGGMGMGTMGMRPIPVGVPPNSGPRLVTLAEAMLIVSNSPLWIKEPNQGGPTAFNIEAANDWSNADLLNAFTPERLAEATPEPRKYMVTFSPNAITRGGGVLGTLSVQAVEKRPPAEVKKVVALAEKLLEDGLGQVYATNRESLAERLRRAEEHLERARVIVEKQQSDVQSLRTRLVQADASPEGVDQQQNTLRADRLKLRVELVGLKARREAIVKAIEEATVKTKATSEEQQRELAELQKIVEIRAQGLSRAQQLAKQAAISTSDVQQAELEVSRARADLAERRRLIAQQAGSDQLSRLNQQLADAQIEMAAAEARVAGIDAMLERLQSKEVLDLLREYGQTTQQLEYARAEEKAAFGQLAELKKTAESAVPPKVVEIRGPQGGNTK